MSRWFQGFLALLAAALAFGAVHLEVASGSDLKVLIRGDAGLFGSRGVGAGPTKIVASAVNRSMKADRIAAPAPALAGPTLVFNVAGLKNTSVATFVALPRPAPVTKDGPRRAIITTAACEPPVSALTEIAAKLETGRCVT